jgi:hypothetical protein
MTKFCNVQKFKSEYWHQVGTQFDNAIFEMQKDRFCEDVIPIPAGATNGDMITIMFPNLTVEDKGGSIYLHYPNGGWIVFDRDWWNAPYERVEEL